MSDHRVQSCTYTCENNSSDQFMNRSLVSSPMAMKGPKFALTSVTSFDFYHTRLTSITRVRRLQSSIEFKLIIIHPVILCTVTDILPGTQAPSLCTTYRGYLVTLLDRSCSRPSSRRGHQGLFGLYWTRADQDTPPPSCFLLGCQQHRPFQEGGLCRKALPSACSLHPVEVQAECELCIKKGWWMQPSQSCSRQK